MGRVNYTTERIIVKLREVEVLCGQGKTIVEAVRQIDISEQTYYRWRNDRQRCQEVSGAGDISR